MRTAEKQLKKRAQRAAIGCENNKSLVGLWKIEIDSFLATAACLHQRDTTKEMRKDEIIGVGFNSLEWGNGHELIACGKTSEAMTF